MNLDDGELESSSISDLQDYLVDTVCIELFQKLIQILSPHSELKSEMFTPDELRSCSGKQDIISDNMYSLHLAYLNWKKIRKGNEQIPEVIRFSVQNIKPKSKEDPKIYKNFIQKRLSEYELKETSHGYLLKKGDKIIISQGMLQIVVEWYHNKLNHPKLSTLIKSIKLQFHIWGVNKIASRRFM